MDRELALLALDSTLRDLLEHDRRKARVRALVYAVSLLTVLREESFFGTYGIERRGDEMRLVEDWPVAKEDV